MGEDASGALTPHERAELHELRTRAYGPDADILGDPAALGRLDELEERVRTGRAERLPPDAEDEAAAEPPPVAEADPVPVPDAAASAPAPRRHTAAIAAAVVGALVMGGAGWAVTQLGTESPPSGQARAAAVAEAQREVGYDAQYAAYFAGLREDVLSLPGAEEIADDLIWEQLTPYGVLYGRTVGAGPTTDQRFCMVIADLPAAEVVCIPIEKASAVEASVQLPAWYSDADSDLFTGLGELIEYTLLPGGVVVAVPADGAADVPVVENPGPTPTATPPPGFN